MDHQTGVLSTCLNLIADTGANILTINQGIPLQNLARVTISFEVSNEISENNGVEMLLENLYDIEGVIKVELIGQN